MPKGQEGTSVCVVISLGVLELSLPRLATIPVSILKMLPSCSLTLQTSRLVLTLEPRSAWAGEERGGELVKIWWVQIQPCSGLKISSSFKICLG